MGRANFLTGHTRCRNATEHEEAVSCWHSRPFPPFSPQSTDPQDEITQKEDEPGLPGPGGDPLQSFQRRL